MLKLYHCKGVRSQRPSWMLEEQRLDDELHILPFPPRVFENPYLDINPLGTVPAFFDGGMRRTESSAIRGTCLQPEPPERRLPQAVEDCRHWFHDRLRAADAAVTQSEYLCARRFTAADIAVGYGLILAGQIQIDQEFSPAVRNYLARLKARPAFQRAAAR